MKSIIRKSYIAVALLLAAPVVGAEPPRAETGAGAAKWTVDDVLLAESAAEVQVSPDGRWAVWVKSAMDPDKGSAVAHLVRSSLTGSRETQLTRGSDSCRSPHWSPDGKLLAFLSERPGPKGKADDKEDGPRAQLWLLDPTGGEPWPLTDFPRGVALYDWAGPGALVFAAQEKAALHESTHKKDNKDDSAVVEDEPHEPHVRLFKVVVASKKVTRLTANGDRIESLAVSPDGRRAVTTNGRSLRYVYDQKIKPAVFLTDLETGERKAIFTDPALNIQEVRWAPDGKGFYAANAASSDPRLVIATVTRLHYYDLASGAAHEIDLGWDRGLSVQIADGDRVGLAAAPDGFVALLADGARNKLARYTRTGPTSWQREEVTGEHAGNVYDLQLSRDGKVLVYAHSSATSPPQWYRAGLDGNRLSSPSAITTLNADFKKKPALRAEVARWKGALGENVEGVLFYPQGYKEGTKYPLVVSIHGGPFWADFDAWHASWADPVPLLTQRGAFVLMPNYHGSSNYGLAFAESIARGKYYDLPVEDIERGVDALIDRGLVDRERLGCMGWSNGAILTTALIAHTTRFRAASAGAGGAEWVADWGACEFGASFDEYYFGKSPLEDPQLYVKLAPLYHFDRVRTPTILFQGDADRAVPPHHAWTQYRALQQLGKAEVRLVFFPGEPHSPGKLAHRRRKVEEELRWFDRHLFGSAREEDEAVKPDSPLARALRLRRVPRDGGRYGVRIKDRLVPETVPHEGLEVGRFEVTASQFAEFDRGYKVEPGRENYPAHGITFAQARAYCRWLSELTGKTYRLPTEAEGEQLYGSADGAGENTLDHWAGYAVNPDDAARLRVKLKELGNGAALLREVGEFKGVGDEEPVFDLGGNVAEWVVRKDGKGRPAGGCAATAADAGPADGPPAEYVGFRVVLAPPAADRVTPANGEFTARLNGLQIWYKVSGRGPVCLMPNPARGPASGYYLSALKPLENHFTMVYLECRGTGRSERAKSTKEYTWDHLAADLEALRLHLKQDRVWLMGHSEAGAMVLSYATRFPDRVSGVVVLDGLAAGDDAWKEDFRVRASRRKDQPWFKQAMQALEKDVTGAAATESEFQQVLQASFPLYWSDAAAGAKHKALFETLPLSLDDLKGSVDSKRSPFDFTKQLKAITAPVLIVVGEDDFICSPAQARRMHLNLPNSKLLLIEKAGHFPWLEQPKAFFEDVPSFLEALGVRKQPG